MGSDESPGRSRPPADDPPRAAGALAVSRRAVLTAGVAGTATMTGAATMIGTAGRAAPPSGAASFGLYGTHQPGIDTPPLPYLSLAGFDVVARGRAELAGLFRLWTGIAERLTGSAETAAGRPRALTLTFGFGPSLFARDSSGRDRFGLAGHRPAPLEPLPAFAGESIDPAASHGDLCVQACAADPTTAHQAIRDLLNAARPQVALRWRQTGFRSSDGTADPRGLFGFRDGTANLDVTDPRQAAEHLWVGDGPAWLHGGSYLVMRRIRLLLDTWDRTAVAQQEAIIGRERDSNRRLMLAVDGHAALASPLRNDGVRLLRRSYSYDAGVDPNGLMDAGLIFLSFQRDPARFSTVQRRLAGQDHLNGFCQHLATGVFACPPGIRRGSYLGAELLS